MSKSCGRCRKFLSSSDSARCQQCDLYFHRRCVDLAPGNVSPSWRCPDCLKNRRTQGKSGSPADISADQNVHSPAESAQTLTSEIAVELKTFRDQLRAVNKDLKLFKDDITEIRDLLKTIHNRVNSLEVRVDALEKRQPERLDDVHETVAKLKQELRDRDQELLGNDIEISSFPEISGENPVHTVMQIATKLGVSVSECDIVCAERVGGRHLVATSGAGPEARARPLAVRLARRDLRDELLRSARVRRGLTSAELAPGIPRHFYVNERLTKANRQLFRLARDAGRRLEWKYIWVKRGRILARRNPGDEACTIQCEADIDRVFNGNTK